VVRAVMAAENPTLIAQYFVAQTHHHRSFHAQDRDLA
jgi:thiamine-phosphate pyrophosphorylase